MTWYAAHIILWTKFLDGVQDSYPVWENVVLINAATSDEAFARADRKGEFEAADSNHTYNGRPVVWVYAGVRKLNECIEHFDPEECQPGGMEEHGTEVTYSAFILSDESALQLLLDDRDVTVLYEGIEPEEDATYIDGTDLDTSYREMAADKEREAEALEWVEGTLGHGCIEQDR